MRSVAAAVVIAGLSACSPSPPRAVPAPMDGVAFEQHLGARLPSVALRDESGREVDPVALLHGRPAVLALVYYRCPMLCPMVEDGLVRGLRGVSLDPGRDYETVVVSIDPREGPDVAAATRARYLRAFDRPGTESGFHFLTGSEAGVRALADAVGFRYRFDAESGQFAHAAGVVVVTPDARVSRYLFGLDFPSTDLRLALVEASDRRIASAVDQVLLYCLCWDPTTGRYGPAVMNVLRLAGGATVLALAATILLLARRGRRRAALAESAV